MKRILFVSPDEDPFALSYGGSQRTNMLLQACAACGQVDVICFRDISSDHTMGDNVQIIYGKSVERPEKKETPWVKLLGLCSAGRMSDRRRVDTRLESIIDSFISQKSYDWIVTRYMNQALSMGLMKYADKLVVDIDDNPVDKAKDSVKTARTMRERVYMLLYVQAMKKAVRSFVDKTAVTFFSNPNQALYYHTRFLPNVPFNRSNFQDMDFERIHKGRLLFVGFMAYYPNYLGMDHFLTHVFPYLNKDKGWEIHICGLKLEESYQKKWSAIEGVRYLGFVKDLSKEYSEAEIVVVPIYHGSGSCIKVLEAMQMHRMVITTPKGIRGHDGILKSGEDYLLAKDDSEFVSLLNESTGNTRLQATITEHAAKVVENRYSKSAVLDIMRDALS